MTTTDEIVLDLSWGERARTAHLDAHDTVKQSGWTADGLETLRVTWHRDCPRCPRATVRRHALRRWKLQRAIHRLANPPRQPRVLGRAWDWLFNYSPRMMSGPEDRSHR